MKTGLSPDDRPKLDRLLSDLARRTDGAIDFWTSLYFWPDEGPFDRSAFVAKNCETIRTLVEEIRTFLQSRRLADNNSVLAPVDNLLVSSEKLATIFGVFEQFRTLPLDQVRKATEQLADAQGAIFCSVQELAKAVGCPVTFLERRTDEHDEYIQGILARLFDLFRKARTTSPAAATEPAIRSD